MSSSRGWCFTTPLTPYTASRETTPHVGVSPYLCAHSGGSWWKGVAAMPAKASVWPVEALSALESYQGTLSV